MSDQQSDEEYSQDSPEAESVSEEFQEKLQSVCESISFNQEPDEEERTPNPQTDPETQTVPFTELLKNHSQQTILGFEFGEESRLSAQKQIKSARDRNSQEKDDNDGKDESEETLNTGKEQESDDEKNIKLNTSIIINELNHKTPHSQRRQKSLGRKRKMRSHDLELPGQSRKTPLPLLEWADNVEVWNFMIYKEEAAFNSRNSRLFEDFSNFTPRMRAILLDWLMEVCEVYHLRRVTYYLSVDYFDRFVSIRPNIPRNQLQLVGITCLFIASKVEEIYPPNITEFAYVCDGACTIEDILACEILILNSLGWEVILTTPTDWLNLYMQLHFKTPEIMMQRLHLDINKNFVFPQYSGYQFTRASQMMDLFSLDPGFLKFRYSVVAASAMYFMYGKSVALNVSGLTWDQLQPCTDYMSVFFKILKNSPDPRLKSYLGDGNDNDNNSVSKALQSRIENIVKNENYAIQTHVANMEYFEQATIIRLAEVIEEKSDESVEEKSKLTDVTNIEKSSELEINDEINVKCDSNKLECTEQLKTNLDNKPILSEGTNENNTNVDDW